MSVSKIEESVEHSVQTIDQAAKYAVLWCRVLERMEKESQEGLNIMIDEASKAGMVPVFMPPRPR